MRIEEGTLLTVLVLLEALAARQHATDSRELTTERKQVTDNLLQNFIDRHLGQSNDYKELLARNPGAAHTMKLLWNYMEDVGKAYPALPYEQKLQKLKEIYAKDMAMAASTEDAEKVASRIAEVRAVYPGLSDEEIFQAGAALAVQRFLTEELLRTYWACWEDKANDGTSLEEKRLG